MPVAVHVDRSDFAVGEQAMIDGRGAWEHGEIRMGDRAAGKQKHPQPPRIRARIADVQSRRRGSRTSLTEGKNNESFSETAVDLSVRRDADPLCKPVVRNPATN